jgi:rRNA maturation RNase YbeY
LAACASSRKTQLGKATMMVAVAGCVAQAEGEEIDPRAPVVDVVFGPQTYHRLPGMPSPARAMASGWWKPSFRPRTNSTVCPMPAGKSRTARRHAFLTVQEGCDKFCTFCVVPYTRGAEVSRPVERIIAEAERLVEPGCARSRLLGRTSMPGMARAATDGSGAGRSWCTVWRPSKGSTACATPPAIPRDMDDALINAHRDLPELMPYLHLPVQSGSDRILKAMNRRHTAAEYRPAGRAHSRGPSGRSRCRAISSSGFPGETDEDFEDTMRLIREVNTPLRSRSTRRHEGEGRPLSRPLYDALYDMMPGDKVERAITAGVIEIAPLAFMRGRTLANAAVILDEAQNTTQMQMKMFLTRLGENSRMIITGDPSQVDLPRGVTSGLKSMKPPGTTCQMPARWSVRLHKLRSARLGIGDLTDKLLSVTLADDETVAQLNAQWRGKPKPTNVLSFPADQDIAIPPGELRPLGDIILAAGVVRAEAAQQSKPLADHFSHLVVHGILHIMGYDHLDDAQADEMESLEKEILVKLGIADPYV